MNAADIVLANVAELHGSTTLDELVAIVDGEPASVAAALRELTADGRLVQVGPVFHLPDYCGSGCCAK